MALGEQFPFSIFLCLWTAFNVLMLSFCSRIYTWKVHPISSYGYVWKRQKEKANKISSTICSWHCFATGWLWLCMTVGLKWAREPWRWMDWIYRIINLFFNLSIISGLLLFDLPLIILSFVYMFSDPINFLLFSLAFPCLPSALTLFYPFLPCHPDTLFLSSWVCQVSTLRD